MARQDTRTVILDATMATLGERGLSALSLEAVADAAGVSRQTIYRHFGTRDQLVDAVILREEQAFIAVMRDAAGEAPSGSRTIERALAVALRMARRHPVLTTLLATEPEALLPYFLLGRSPVVSAAEPVVAEVLGQRHPDVDDDRLHLLADMVTRLLVSYVVSPPEGVDDERLAAELAALVAAVAAPRDGADG